MDFKNAVCRGSVALKNNCGHCERCALELRKFQAANAEKSDTHQPDLFDGTVSYAFGGVVGGNPPHIVGEQTSEQIMSPVRLKQLVHKELDKIVVDKLSALSANIGPVVTGSLKMAVGGQTIERFANGDVTIHDGGEIQADKITVSGIKNIAAASSPVNGHSGLPVAGYAPKVEQWRVDMLNENKIIEERVLRRVDQHVRNRDSQEIDQASVQLARRHVEDAFYRLNRAVMQPKRIPGDLE